MTVSAIAAMPEDLWSDLVGAGTRRFYTAGSLIFAEGDYPGPDHRRRLRRGRAHAGSR